jgi:precorrin-4/cobalt-precorrin-4 C11-methyltransferase
MEYPVASGKVYIIGAGPGAPDLLTLRGRDIIARADVIVSADSLVHPGVAAFARPDAEVYGSATRTLEEVMAIILAAVRDGKTVARVHSGDPSIYGAVHEQIAILEREGIPYEIVPGVSSAFAAAARLGIELTVPDVTQTVIFTRQAGRTAVPERERLRDLAAHGCSLVLFLSVALIDRVVAELRAAGYADDTPVAVVYRVSWADEQVLRGMLADIAARVKEARLQLHALILVGPTLDLDRRAGEQHRSNLYSPGYSHRHRRSTRAPSETTSEGGGGGNG